MLIVMNIMNFENKDSEFDEKLLAAGPRVDLCNEKDWIMKYYKKTQKDILNDLKENDDKYESYNDSQINALVDNKLFWYDNMYTTLYKHSGKNISDVFKKFLGKYCHSGTSMVTDNASSMINASKRLFDRQRGCIIHCIMLGM